MTEQEINNLKFIFEAHTANPNEHIITMLCEQDANISIIDVLPCTIKLCEARESRRYYIRPKEYHSLDEFKKALLAYQPNDEILPC